MFQTIMLQETLIPPPPPGFSPSCIIQVLSLHQNTQPYLDIISVIKELHNRNDISAEEQSRIDQLINSKIAQMLTLSEGPLPNPVFIKRVRYFMEYFEIPLMSEQNTPLYKRITYNIGKNIRDFNNPRIQEELNTQIEKQISWMFFHKKPDELSAEQQQKVKIAQQARRVEIYDQRHRLLS